MIILTKAEAYAFAGFDAAYEGLWHDVQSLADRVHLSSDTDRPRAWHHLLLAAVNFKAQIPLFLAPLPRGPADEHDFKRASSLKLPVVGGSVTLRVDDLYTWRDLSDGVRGLGVPRTTTVLSALWPGCHLIADWRALSSAAALVGARNGWAHTPVQPDSDRKISKDWDTYWWYRQVTRECARDEGLLLIQLERALYRLGDPMPGARWAEYAAQIEKRLASISSSS